MARLARITIDTLLPDEMDDVDLSEIEAVRVVVWDRAGGSEFHLEEFVDSGAVPAWFVLVNPDE